MKGGCKLTDLKARTGLLTPPGMSCCASERALRTCFHSGPSQAHSFWLREIAIDEEPKPLLHRGWNHRPISDNGGLQGGTARAGASALEVRHRAGNNLLRRLDIALEDGQNRPDIDIRGAGMPAVIV